MHFPVLLSPWCSTRSEGSWVLPTQGYNYTIALSLPHCFAIRCPILWLYKTTRRQRTVDSAVVLRDLKIKYFYTLCQKLRDLALNTHDDDMHFALRPPVQQRWNIISFSHRNTSNTDYASLLFISQASTCGFFCWRSIRNGSEGNRILWVYNLACLPSICQCHRSRKTK